MCRIIFTTDNKGTVRGRIHFGNADIPHGQLFCHNEVLACVYHWYVGLLNFSLDLLTFLNRTCLYVFLCEAITSESVKLYLYIILVYINKQARVSIIRMSVLTIYYLPRESSWLTCAKAVHSLNVNDIRAIFEICLNSKAEILKH